MESCVNILEEILKKEKKISSGLYSGGMGVCLSLYLINKSKNDEEIDKLAEMFLEKTIQAINNIKETSFGAGLAGIGWAINLLHMNKCIEGDIDDILYNIDAAIYKDLCTQRTKFSIDIEDGLVGYLVYVVSRLKNRCREPKSIQNQINEAALRIVVDQLEVKMANKFPLLSKDLLSTILWEFPILFYYLGEAVRLGVYKEKIASMISNWSYTITGHLPFSNINRLALANSLAYTNLEIGDKIINRYVDVLFYSIDFDDYVHEIDKSNTCINGEWFCALFNVYMAQKLMARKHIRYSDLNKKKKEIISIYNNNVSKTLSNIDVDKQNSSLISGYSGTLLVKFICQSIFRKSGSKTLII